MCRSGGIPPTSADLCPSPVLPVPHWKTSVWGHPIDGEGGLGAESADIFLCQAAGSVTDCQAVPMWWLRSGNTML